MQSNYTAGGPAKFSSVDYDMIIVKTITSETVDSLALPCFKTAYAVALVLEWSIEVLRPLFSPYKESSIAGSASVFMNRLHLDIALENRHFVDEMLSLIDAALNSGKNRVFNVLAVPLGNAWK